jgi:hypothetical protein
MVADGRWDLTRRLTLILLTWRIWWAPNNGSRWQMRFNSAFRGLQKDYLTRSTLSSDTRGRPVLFPLQRHPVVGNCWYQRLMLLGEGGLLLNCRRNICCTETTDSCFVNSSTQNAFCSRVVIIALLRHRPREKRGMGLRMRTKLEHLLFRSMCETY